MSPATCPVPLFSFQLSATRARIMSRYMPLCRFQSVFILGSTTYNWMDDDMDAMVTARMSATKKAAGNRALERLGSNASQAINELYDYLIDKNELPWENNGATIAPIAKEELDSALSWVSGLGMSLSDEFAAMSTKEARLRRLGIEQS